MKSLVGKTVDNYLIEEIIGRGGMGIVYKAIDVTLDKVVVLKMIDPHLVQDKDFLKRFRNEPKLQAKLHSPLIVQVFAFRENDQGLFIVMEYVDGGTLSQLIRKHGRIPIKAAVPLFKSMLRAIDAAHQVGVVHRDIKPQNVLLTKQGDIKVTDFGLAKFLEAKDATRTHTVAGTLNYMPPEQVEGLSRVDQRSDLYSLAMTFYEMLAGRVPFEKGATEYRILKSIVEEQLPSPMEFNPAIPPELSAIIMRCLEKDADKRYQTAGEVIAAVEAFENGRQEQAGAATAFTETPLPPVEATIVGEAPFRDRSVAPAESPPQHSEPYHEPQLPAEPVQGSGANWKVVGAAIISLILIGASFAYYSSRSAGPVDSDLTPLTIHSRPPGAAVFINHAEVGSTTYQGDYAAGEGNRIRLEAAGYRAWEDSNIVFTAGKIFSLDLDLIPLSAATSLVIASTPAGASILVDGQPNGTTPRTLHDILPGTHRIRIESDGYNQWTETVKLEDGDTRTLHATLVKSQPVAVIQSGELVLNSQPAGAVYVDDELKSANLSGPLSLSADAGRHEVKFTHPEYGNRTFTVDVTANERSQLTCYFESRINVQSLDESGEPLSALLIINGEPTEQWTPLANLPLGPGTYKITLQRRGYEPVEPVQEFQFAPSSSKVEKTFVFTLHKL